MSDRGTMRDDDGDIIHGLSVAVHAEALVIFIILAAICFNASAIADFVRGVL